MNCTLTIIAWLYDRSKAVLFFSGSLVFLCLVFLMRSRLFIAALSLAGKGLTSWLLLVMSIVFCYFSKWYPESCVILDCIVSRSLPSFLL